MYMIDDKTYAFKTYFIREKINNQMKTWLCLIFFFFCVKKNKHFKYQNNWIMPRNIYLSKHAISFIEKQKPHLQQDLLWLTDDRQPQTLLREHGITDV